MATTAVARKEEQRVARPLKVLVPLIQEDLRLGKEAANAAGLPYFRAAGEKMLEAKENFTAKEIAAGDFNAWIARNFGLKKLQARYYMSFAEASARKAVSAITASSLSDFLRESGEVPSNYNTFASRKPAWQPEVKQIINRVDTETLNLKRAELDRQEELDAQRALALNLIDIGFKVLAKELHPDKKDGSKAAMTRLNAVRTALRDFVKGAAWQRR